MSNQQHRRGFLRNAALAAAGAASGIGGVLLPRPTRAIEPIQRIGKPKFKFSLAGYSYRDLLSGNPPKLGLEDFITDCAKMGLEGTEPTSYYFPKPVTPEYLRKIRALAFRLGLDISGTGVGNDFCQPDGEKLKAQIRQVKQWIDYAEILGAPVIRIFSGSRKGTQTVEEARRVAVAAMEECCDYAGQHGVHLALENHGGLTAQVDSMLELIRAVKSPWFGVNLDSGNFSGADPYGDLAKIAPYAINTHIKVSLSIAGKRTQADYRRLAKILSDAGYRGYISLEYEEREDPRVACARETARIREAFGG
jgi:sugar phosphate isomerase/epimerase